MLRFLISSKKSCGCGDWVKPDIIPDSRSAASHNSEQYHFGFAENCNLEDGPNGLGTQDTYCLLTLLMGS